MRVSVVIPSYRVRKHILGVISAVGPEVDRIYVVDDSCPEKSGEFVSENCDDSRVRVLTHETNQGVGGAVMTGYIEALDEGFDVVVKVDGDGQMDPRLIPQFLAPLREGIADYTKGNRFFEPSGLASMPLVRKLGNAALSFLTKLSSGYWNIMDPTNGYTAIHRAALRALPLKRVSRDYFFESDLLFRLNTINAVVLDIPMVAQYGDETSSLKPFSVMPSFAARHTRNCLKRIIYSHFLRGFSIASLNLLVALPLLLFSFVFGVNRWVASISTGEAASAGTVMLAAFPGFVGLQLLLSFFSADMSNNSRVPLQRVSRR